MKPSLNHTPAAALLAALLALPGCTRPTRISTHAAGHSITAEVDGGHSLESLPTQAVLVGEFGKITVEPARVQLGGGDWIVIPEGVPIEMGIAKRKRWIIAGGVTIEETN